jgi:pimeloyl-ACP methyl ester carboxylesterase/DNA-binding SARP family transcriptional activator
VYGADGDGGDQAELGAAGARGSWQDRRDQCGPTARGPIPRYRADVDVSIRLLDAFCLEVDGRPVTAADFPRRSAVTLVKLLALAPGRRLHREQVMDALWPDADPDDAANQLHKAAHYARVGTGEPTALVLRAQLVWLFPDAHVEVDVLRVEAVAADLSSAEPGSADASRAEAALALFGAGPLPEDLYAPWAAQHRLRLEAVHRQLLRWAGHWAQLVALDPRDEEAHLGLARSLLAHGDRAGALHQIDAIERILDEELGIGLSPEGIDLRIEALDTPVGVPAPAPAGPVRPRHAGLSRQTVGFCRAADGIRLAHAVSGAGPPLVKAANWLTHLDYDWASPVWTHWWRELSRHHRLVRYDERGSGLSDWDVPDASYSLDAWVADLEAVVDAQGHERFDLLGISQGGAVAVEYAARHPERIRRLVLYGAYAQGRLSRATSIDDVQLNELQCELARVGWGSDDPAFRQVFTAQFMPGGSKELWSDFNELQRRSTTAQNAARLLRLTGDIDVREAALRVRAPTLVLHARDDQRPPFAQGRLLAELIPGARFVALESCNHILLEDEPAWPVFLEQVEAFLAPPQVAH